MKILTIIGARPQFIKAATVSREIEQNSGVQEVLVHTGQHFDENMSQVFFDELEIPKPDYNLGIGGGSHGQNTGRMIEAIEKVLMDEKPDWVLVYGDTDSTLAGALAAAKLHIPVAHVEAGLRSFNRRMPEEINRVLTDHTTDFLFAPTRTAVENLRKEGVCNMAQEGRLFDPSQPVQSLQDSPCVVNVGDVMFDAALFYKKKGKERSGILEANSLNSGGYILATVHRAENTDDSTRLRAVMKGLDAAAENMPVVLPLHPRTRAALQREAIFPKKIRLLDPLGYLDMVALEANAAVVVTDSGGVQKEAFFHNVPCVTLREETEWVELVELGWNRLAPPHSAQKIVKSVWEARDSKPVSGAQPYGSGKSAGLIVDVLQAKMRIYS